MNASLFSPWILLLAAAACYCVAPATASAQRNLTRWSNILSFRPSTEVQSHVHSLGDECAVHRIEDADGPLNLDYYPVRITQFPTVNGTQMTAASLLKHVRVNVNNFVDNDISTFEAYRDDDATLWESNSPRKSVLLIKIRLVNSLAVSVTDLALVVCSDSAANEFRFSTVRGGSGFTAINDRDNPGAHPVSGNRAFGFFTQGNTTTFYTIGADRATRAMDTFWGVPWANEVGYEKADELWKSYQHKLAEFVNNNGGTASVDGPATSSRRFNWDDTAVTAVYDTSGQPNWVPRP